MHLCALKENIHYLEKYYIWRDKDKLVLLKMHEEYLRSTSSIEVYSQVITNQIMKLKEGIIHLWFRKDTILPMNDLYSFLTIVRVPLRFYRHKNKQK